MDAIASLFATGNHGVPPIYEKFTINSARRDSTKQSKNLRDNCDYDQNIKIYLNSQVCRNSMLLMHASYLA